MKSFLSMSILLIIFILSGCASEESTSVDQSRIYTAYELFYDINEDKTYAFAQFRFGNNVGTTLKLTDPSKVTFNGDVLTFVDATATYSKQYAGFVKEGTFKWNDTKDKVYTNAVVIKEPIAFPAITKIPRSTSFEIDWIGEPLGANESIGLLLTGPSGETPQAVVLADLNSTSIIIPKNQLDQIAGTQANVGMDRAYKPTIAEAPAAGGTLSGKYRAKIISVTLE